MQDYHPDPHDFNVVASRIHRTLQVRKELEPFLSQDQGDDYYLRFIEHALSLLQEMHDEEPENWYNPSVSYEIGNERFIFTWQGKGEQYDLHHKRLEVRIDMNMTIYTIDSIDNHVVTSLDFGTLNQDQNIASVWLQWTLVNS